MRAWAYGLRAKTRCSNPFSAISSRYAPLPATSGDLRALIGSPSMFGVTTPCLRRLPPERGNHQRAGQMSRRRPASSAVRRGRLSVSTCSCAAWAPSPFGAQAIEGRHAKRGGEVAVRAAPRAAFGELDRHRGGDLRSRSKSSPIAGERSIGGRFSRPSIVRVAPGSLGVRARIAASIRAASARVSTRTSTWASASAATTFGRVPPWTTPTFRVVPAA